MPRRHCPRARLGIRDEFGAGGKIGCALSGVAIWSSGDRSSSVKVVTVVAPYRPAHCVELAFDHLVASEVVGPVKGSGELANAGQIGVIDCRIAHFTLCSQADRAKQSI
jgi:hypothetical protein